MNLCMELKHKFMVTKGERGQGRDKLRLRDQHIHTATFEIDTQQCPLYNTGNYIQHLVISHMAKNMKKNIYIYLYLNPIAVHQKQRQHCKSTILQFEDKFKK